jgi:RNA polymerase sigma-70 factor (ECF subfamily)
MKTPADSINLHQGIELDCRPPGRQALDANLVNEAQLLRLKVIARLHARGLPPHLSWVDLLQEAFTRVLDGSRHQPEGIPMVTFVAGVMRSIKEQYWRQARRGARKLPILLAELEPMDLYGGEPLDPQPSPERRIIAIQEMEAINKLFEDDLPARQIISALYEGWTPEETCANQAMSKTDYDSTRKRIRRALIKAGLRTLQP